MVGATTELDEKKSLTQDEKAAKQKRDARRASRKKAARAAASMQFKGSYSNIGLDLGTSQIKAVQLRSQGRDIALYKQGIFPLPEGVIEQGRVIEPEILAENLKLIIKQLKFWKNKVNLCVGSQNVILRTITLPFMAEKEIPEAIRWESEKHIMIPADEVVTDYIFEREKEEEDKKMLEMILVAVPKEVIRGYIEAIGKAGLHPEVVEIEPFALHRAMERAFMRVEMDEKEAVLVMDIGGEVSNLLVMENRDYGFSRTLNMGVNHFCRHIADVQNVDLEVAREMLFSNDPFAVQGVQDIADELVEQVRRSVEYYVYRVQSSEKEFKDIVLCGGGANIKGLGSFFGQELMLEHKTFNMVGMLGAKETGGLNVDINLLSIASGLALRGWVQ